MSKSKVGVSILVAASVIGFVTPQHSFAGSSVAVVVDRAHDRRWELAWGSVAAYDIESGKLLRTLRLPHAFLSGSRESCAPDMIVDRNGVLFVSSNVEPKLWRIGPTRFEIEILDLELDSDREREIGFTRLAWNGDGSVLQAVNAATGTSWQVDVVAGTARKVGQSADYEACAVR